MTQLSHEQLVDGFAPGTRAALCDVARVYERAQRWETDEHTVQNATVIVVCMGALKVMFQGALKGALKVMFQTLCFRG